MYSGKQFHRNIFSPFLRKVFIVSEDLIVIGSCFQTVGAATEKARLSSHCNCLRCGSYGEKRRTLSIPPAK